MGRKREYIRRKSEIYREEKRDTWVGKEYI